MSSLPLAKLEASYRALTGLPAQEWDALVTALKQFTGTLIFISHDVYFIRELSNHVVRVEAGQLSHFPGGYQYYLDKTAATSPESGNAPAAAANGNSRPVVKGNRKEQKRLEAEQRQARSGERKAHQDPFSSLQSISRP